MRSYTAAVPAALVLLILAGACPPVAFAQAAPAVRPIMQVTGGLSDFQVLPRDDQDKARACITGLCQPQAGAIEALQEGQAEILAEVNQPIVIDAELRATLAEVPVQCRKDMGGDPTSVQCQWATCLQFGQSSAQRPECRAVETLMIERLQAQE